MQEKKIAILLFSQDAPEEFRHKTFGLNFSRFRQVHQALVSGVRETIKATRLPFFEANSAVQQGADFGSRLVNAIRWVESQGFQKLIIVGNDSPALSADQLMAAQSALQKGQSSLGRDLHGGAYLIGLETTQTNLEQVRSIQWQSSRVFDQLVDLLPNTEFLQEELVDLNEACDLTGMAARLRIENRLLRLLWQLVFGLIQHLTILLPEFDIFEFRVRHERGPPALA